MILKILTDEFVVSKVDNLNNVNLNEDYTFIAKTDEELSLVCPVQNVPESTLERDPSWRKSS